MSGKKHPDGNNQSRSLMKQEQITGIQATAISYSSPIPPPEIISQYELIIPEAANRILTAFLKQSNHRQKIEKDVIYGDNIRSFLGLLCGFAIALGALFTTIYISSISAPFSAAIFGSTGMADLVGVFIYGKMLKFKI